VNLKRRPLHGAGTADRIEGPAIENVHYFGFVLPDLQPTILSPLDDVVVRLA
jgi:hypothetical protein